MASMIFEQEIGSLLSNNPVQLAHPGRSLVATGLYAQPANASVNVVPELNTIGRLKISSNSLSFGSSSQFQIPPQSIDSQFFLHAEVVYARYVHSSSMWLLEMIDQIQYQVSGNSSINNVSLNGASHRDLVLASVDGEEKRLKMFPVGGVVDGNAAGGTAKATIPLYLPWSSPDRMGAFPIDTSALSSNIVITIRWKQGFNVFNGQNAQTPVLPSAFSSLFLKSFQTDLLNGAFAISRAQSMDRSLSYNIPTYLTQSYVTDVAITPGTKSTVALSSLPQGQLICIMVSASPASWKGVAAGTTLIQPQSATFDYSRLTHNGQDIYVAESEDEIRCINALAKKGGSYDYQLSYGDSYTWTANATRSSYVMVMPLVYDLESALEDRHHQAVKSYGGSVLQHEVDFASTMPTATYTLTYTFVFNAILSITDKVTSMVI